jgi:multiple sugar transport system ATP-binding protein
MASVTLHGVRKRYPGGAEVVRGIDLAIADGELVTLVGPSGCGKSTLLNLIAGLEAPSAGTIAFDGEDVTARPPRQRDVAMVFQSYALYPHMTVRRNLAFPLEVAGLDARSIATRVDEVAQRLEIAPLLARKPKELSGGQRQRVALGRALVRKPRVYLFDEPLSNLDAGLRAQMRAELKTLHEALRATFIYVTHDQAEAMTLSDRVVVLNEGVIQQAAPPREVYARPANTFVAGFIGAPRINLVPAAALGLPDAPGTLAGLRPEAITVGTGPAPARAIAARVWVTEPMGAETWVTLDVGGTRVTGRAAGDFDAASGSPAWLAFDPAALHRFDADSGARRD